MHQYWPNLLVKTVTRGAETANLAGTWIRLFALTMIAILYGPSAEAQPERSQIESPKRSKKSKLKPFGRIFVRNTLSQDNGDNAPWTNTLEIRSARLGLKYNKQDLRAVVEVDFADNDVSIKKALLQIQLIPDLQLFAGRFKVPLSLVALESSWKLPLIDRGLLGDEVQTALYNLDLPVGGRSEGIALTYSPLNSRRLIATVGVFNSNLLKGRGDISDPFESSENEFADGYARLQIQPWEPLTIAATAAALKRVRTPNVAVDYGFLASLEVHWKSDWLRAWGEGFVGSSPYVDDTQISARGIFWATRTLVSVPFTKPLDWLYRIEPFVSFSALELTTKVNNTRNFEFSLGLNFQLKKHWRLQAEYKLRTGDRSLEDANLFLSQISTVF